MAALPLVGACFATGTGGESANGNGSTSQSKGSQATSTSSSSHSNATSAGNGGGSSSSSAPSTGMQPGLMGPYSVSGNKILDKNGNEHFFRGLDRPSLEYSCAGDIQENDYFLMNEAWYANVVRVPLNQDCWLNDPSNPSYDSTYEATVDDQVQWAKKYGMDIILDLHWSDQGSYSLGAQCLQNNGTNTMPNNCQQDMADAHSTTFWQQVATKYASSPNVLFELYNEPRVGSYMPTSASWNVWLNGGMSSGYAVVGMQSLYSTVHTAAPNNLVVIGGLNWAFDLSGVMSNPVMGTNIIYNTHPYRKTNTTTVSSLAATWPAAFGNVAATYPVIATEFGDYSTGQPTNCDPSFDTALIQYMGQQSSPSAAHKMSWTAWAFYPESTSCTFPSLIEDSNDDPNDVGTVVTNALMAGP